jgi:hypothetical protein
MAHDNDMSAEGRERIGIKGVSEFTIVRGKSEKVGFGFELF